MCLPSSMAGEALAYVQGESLKVNATVLLRFVNSPSTSSDVGGRFATKGSVMALFKRKPKQPFDAALAHVAAAVEILYCYKRDKSYQPTEQDLLMFIAAQKALWEASVTAGYVAQCLHQRHRGEPEGSKKFSNAEVERYHYPS